MMTEEDALKDENVEHIDATSQVDTNIVGEASEAGETSAPACPAAGTQQADGKRQIISRAFFADIGRCHIYNQVTGRHFIAIDLQCGDNTLMAFFDRRVRQTD